MKTISLLFLLLSSVISVNASAQSAAADYTVELTASVTSSPPHITLHWKHDSRAVTYGVYRRMLGDIGSWGPEIPLTVSDSTYTDANVTTGAVYEYEVVESAKSGTTAWTAQGFITSGIDVLPATQPGTVVLLVDETYASALASEIAQWVSDVKAEGWNVIRHDVSRTESVPQVRELDSLDYESDPTHVRTIFILGHVPVPYSGDLAPDGHVPGKGNHQGAWPADVFYGDIYGDWTDNTVDDTTAYDPRNRNVPGDGKFDQSQIDVPSSMEVGRVDFYNMPAFKMSDTALLKQYLDRDHAFRTGQLTVPNRALVDVNFPVFETYDVPGEDAWRNFPPLVGTNNIVDFHAVSKAGDWSGYLDTAKYLWAYGCGGGSWASCGGVGTTQLFADSGADALFYMVFGSFFGDWDCQNNFDRAPLLTAYGLEDCWVSRPFWYFHPLGMGETFGYCARLTQNDGSSGFYDYVLGYEQAGVHVALMGDPTLRMEYLSSPPTALSASVQGNSVQLSWTAPSVHVPGYNIYRSDATGDTLLQINSSLVVGTSYTDAAPLNDSNIYVVRAAALTTTPSGSWWNESGGVTQGVKVTLADVARSQVPQSNVTVYEAAGFLNVHVSESSSTTAHLALVDETGREIKVIEDGSLSPGEYNYRVNTAAMPSGAYFVRLVTNAGIRVAKIAIVR